MDIAELTSTTRGIFHTNCDTHLPAALLRNIKCISILIAMITIITFSTDEHAFAI